MYVFMVMNVLMMDELLSELLSELHFLKTMFSFSTKKFQGGTSVVVPYCSCCLCLYFGSSIMLVTYFVNFRKLNDHLFGKELFILFAASAFRKLSSIYVFSYFPFGFEGRIWDLIVSVPDHCLSFYFEATRQFV